MRLASPSRPSLQLPTTDTSLTAFHLTNDFYRHAEKLLNVLRIYVNTRRFILKNIMLVINSPRPLPSLLPVAGVFHRAMLRQRQILPLLLLNLVSINKYIIITLRAILADILQAMASILITSIMPLPSPFSSNSSSSNNFTLSH